MTPDFAESLFIFFVALAILLGAFIGLDAVVTLAGLILRKGRVRPVSPPRLIMPERYSGCLTCEALDGMGAIQRMFRHQKDEHAGGVRW